MTNEPLRSDATTSRTSTRTSAWVDRVALFGLSLCLIITPFVLGGRHDFARFVYVAGAAIAATGTAFAERGRRTRTPLPWWFVTCWSAAMALLVVQVLPLPDSVRAWIAPDLTRALPLWTDQGPFGPWSVISVSPAATRQALALLLAHGLFFASLLMRLRNIEDIRLLVRCLAAITLAMAVLGVIQHALGEDKLLGIYSHPHRSFSEHLRGAFTNQNHFAHLLVLGLGPLGWVALNQRRVGPEKSSSRGSSLYHIAAVAAVAFVVLVILATQSRGALVAFAAAGATTLILLWRFRWLGIKQLVAVAALATVAIGGLSFFNEDRVAERLGDLMSSDVDRLDAKHARRSIWAANWEAFLASPAMGFGAGTHREFYPLFLDGPFPKTFTHAESGYLQIASECGLIGLGLLAIVLMAATAILATGVAGGSGDEHDAMWITFCPGLIASLIHSVVDFVWYLPGLLAVTLALLAGAIRLRALQHAGTAPTRLPSPPQRLNWRLATAAFLGAFATATALEPAWASASRDAYLRASHATRLMAEREFQEAPGQADPMLQASLIHSTERIVALLQDVVAANPNDARAHSQLSSRLLHLYALKAEDSLNPMPIELLADAVERGGFTGQAEIDTWLDTAIGPQATRLRSARRHALAAVKLSPLLASAYLDLADLAFLEPGGARPDRLAEQALAVQPHNGDVLYRAGWHHSLSGDSEKTAELWRRAIRTPGGHLTRLVTLLAKTLPAASVVTDLNPGLEALQIALPLYQAAGDPRDLKALCDHAIVEVRRIQAGGDESPTRLAYRWRHSSETLRSLGRFEEAVESAARAVELAPHILTMRLELATALHRSGRHEEADPHIRWCLTRRPDIDYLRKWLAEAASARLAASRADRFRVASLPVQPESETSAGPNQRSTQ